MAKLNAEQLKGIRKQALFVSCDTGVGRAESSRWIDRATVAHEELTQQMSAGWTARNQKLAEKAQEGLNNLQGQIEQAIQYWGLIA
jgi:hypothetical protein